VPTQAPAARAGDAAGGQHRHGDRVEDHLQQGQRRHVVAAMAPALAAPGHDHVDTGPLRGLGLGQGPGLGGHRHPGLAQGRHVALIGAVADRHQRRACRQDRIELAGVIGQQPGQQADPERPASRAGDLALLADPFGRDRSGADHAEPAAAAHGRGQLARRGPRHRRANHGNIEPEPF
jgi:hypothetical protein